jgi:hypothetical protein
MGLLKKSEAPKVWFEVGNLRGFEVEVMYMGPDDLKAIRTTCTRNVLNPATRQVEPQVDEEAVSRGMVKTMVKGWRGLTVDVLRKLMPVDKEVEASIEAAGGELPFSQDDLDFIAEHTYASAFMSAVMQLAMDMQSFRQAEIAVAAKNSAG